MTLKYTRDHQWVRQDGEDLATVGITEHGQDVLGEIVSVELPPVGKHLDQGEIAGSVESIKAAVDVSMPIAGVIVEVNEALLAKSELANRAPMEAGWLFRLRISDPRQLAALLDEPAYRQFSAEN
ncbi:glycine cleavage system protein GcvH [Variovorax sp. Sphag1AA]|uniref:glycine cleavage system protein GcvH n=1 Tax=Variovorax sp. Sphag1AA TaxID=2587027 RepID=UPI00161CD7F2|nr:glycine cleavage system protein GcvH [Variovorax sp. Sphag1AA]MBB3176374.1 glycine cleavage system H protein [Variovorax sp. Sphag1AA]